MMSKVHRTPVSQGGDTREMIDVSPLTVELLREHSTVPSRSYVGKHLTSINPLDPWCGGYWCGESLCDVPGHEH